MSYKKMNLFYVLKLNTSYINKCNHNVNFSFREAKEGGMVISLGDNQLLKFIRQVNDIKFDKDHIDYLYSERDKLKLLKGSKKNSSQISEIQSTIDELLFVPDLISIKVDTSKKDYKYICKNGFSVSISINNKSYNMTYKRLCAGAGQLRRNSALFVNSNIYDSLEQIMMCGLTKSKIGKINLAKFSAYYALYTSATNQVSKPRVCVVKDYEYTLKNQTVSWIYDNKYGEKDIEDRVIDIEQNAFDGSGMVSVQMANKWRDDLSLDYTPASFIIRSAWIKGLVSVFDFKRFSKEISKKDIIIDVWGKEHNVEEIDVILMTSQFKMYKKYNSWDEYMYYHSKFNHVYGIARASKKENNFLTPLNYQYIQSNSFTEESIKGLADFSVNWIDKIMKCDKLYTMLFLVGCQAEDENIDKMENNLNSYISKAIMYNDNLLNDDYIRRKVTQMIDRKIQQIKIGKLLVEGSYDFCIPDLYAMCEHIFGMEVKGLLKSKQGWNKRWVDKGSSVVSMMRSPLVAPSENQLMNIYSDDRCLEWFQHINSGMVLNIWDTALMRASDADYDGDLVLTSDNQYLVNSVNDALFPITYEKKKAKEQRLNFNNFANMDVKSFNSKVGFITNLASNFIAMQSSFSKESEEYKELKKRVDLLRFYQGSAIDATKGDIFIAPPKHWSKKQRYLKVENAMSLEEKEDIMIQNRKICFNNRITGDKKPYFFGYIYPKYMEEFQRHKSNYKKMAQLIYSSKLYDLLKKSDKTQGEKTFVQKYYRYMPLLVNGCTMNALSFYVENMEFDNKWKKHNYQFDYHILMSENFNISNKSLYKQIKDIVSEFHRKHNSIISEKKMMLNSDDIILETDDIDNYSQELTLLMQDYELKLLTLCSNASVTLDYLVDIYYKHFNNKSKLLLWGEFGEYILRNIKKKSETICYPVLDDNGTEYLGQKYSLKVVSNNGYNI